MKNKIKQPNQNLDDLEKDFLTNNPKIKRALDIFGITNKEYTKFIAAQQKPVFFTSNTTIEGGINGELD